jgi:RNA polymerase sigma-70 factor, ECF subfamily
MREMFTTPASLLERIRTAPSTTAWEQFVELYTPLLFAWARRLSPDEHDVADLVQEVFVALVEALPRFHYDANRSFRAWLKTILLNTWRKHRARVTRTKVAANGTVDEVADTDPCLELDEIEYRKHLVARILQLMQVAFEPVTWKACWGYVVEGRSPDAVAQELGITTNAVYLAKSRVLRQLRTELHGLLD